MGVLPVETQAAKSSFHYLFVYFSSLNGFIFVNILKPLFVDFLFNQINTKFRDERLSVLEQRIIYGKLHGVYKKALNKALQNNFRSEQLIYLLENFLEDEDDEQEKFTMKKIRKRCGKGRPLGTKRFKSAHETYKPNLKSHR
ncbi:14017_t:CDS:2 [Funneliformis caledonium]|uniref:14017_t:CDS:1 n=1 Tax=Funneliformis caledonium TaxID=1117310 RepID=A0A9N9HGR6_9GLOM|nr:14017_t:CDS:2 [Funneliformis caledonium]